MDVRRGLSLVESAQPEVCDEAQSFANTACSSGTKTSSPGVIEDQTSPSVGSSRFCRRVNRRADELRQQPLFLMGLALERPPGSGRDGRRTTHIGTNTNEKWTCRNANSAILLKRLHCVVRVGGALHGTIGRKRLISRQPCTFCHFTLFCASLMSRIPAWTLYRTFL